MNSRTPPLTAWRLWPRLALSALTLLATLAGGAAQACAAAETGGGTVATVNSQRIASGSAITAQGSFSFNCGNTVLSVLGTPTLKGQLQAATTGLTLKNGAFSIPYTLYSNSGMSTGYSSGLIVINLNSTTLVGLLNGNTGTTIPVYIATTPGANVPAGTYSDTIQVTWTYANICEGVLGIAGICVGVPNNGTATRSITFSVVVTNDCTITAPPVAFNTAPLVASFPTVSQNILLTCSKNMSYTVGLTTGGSPAPNGRRRMVSGASRLEYDIFKADSTVWGPSGTARASPSGVADGVTAQQIPYTARIYTDQATPPAGTYTDNVVVDVTF